MRSAWMLWQMSAEECSPTSTQGSLTFGCSRHWPWTFLSLSYSSFDPTLTSSLNFPFWMVDSHPFSRGLLGSCVCKLTSLESGPPVSKLAPALSMRLTLASKTGYPLSPLGGTIPQLSTTGLGLTYNTAPRTSSSSPDSDNGAASFENRAPKQCEEDGETGPRGISKVDSGRTRA